ncbi:hypothetical protein [Paludisphaera rhizosphaerae]|nr:hypothetical protein [Paludisphaera rhizosphaerae]
MAALLVSATTGAMIFGKRQGPSQGEAVSFVIVLVAVSVFLTWLGLRLWYGKDWWVKMAVDEHGLPKATPRDLD